MGHTSRKRLLHLNDPPNLEEPRSCPLTGSPPVTSFFLSSKFDGKGHAPPFYPRPTTSTHSFHQVPLGSAFTPPRPSLVSSTRSTPGMVVSDCFYSHFAAAVLYRLGGKSFLSPFYPLSLIEGSRRLPTFGASTLRTLDLAGSSQASEHCY